MSDPSALTGRLNSALEGHYAIERQIGEGGMATVYLAEDLKHQRQVALKVLKPELAAVVGGERFLAEIRTTAKLRHPHILPLFDSGQADSFLYYVMPYIEGESLQERIDLNRQLPVDEAVKIARRVAGALQHAHEQGVIHRDIKPGNILFQDNEPVVTDFGIALAAGVVGGTRLTEIGLSVGTPFYMSPEQATGEGMGPQSDTYSLACVLYEMLVGEPPHQGSTAQAVLGQIIVGDAVSVTKKRPTVPPNVDAAIRKGLEKLPADRFGSAQDFAKALADPLFRYGEEEKQDSESDPTVWRTVAIGALGVAGLAVGWALWASLMAAQPAAPVSAYLLDPGAGATSTLFGRNYALAPDGSSMILPLPEPSGPNYQLGVKTRGSTETSPLSDTWRGRDVTYSPDGRSIAFRVVREIWKRPLFGGSATMLAADGDDTVEALAWLDDGTILYEQETSDGERLVRISEDGGELIGTVFDAGEDLIWAHGLPGAQGLLVITGAFDLHVVSLSDGSSSLALEQVLRAWYAPTGHLIYVRRGGTVFAAPFDIRAMELTGDETLVLDGIRTFDTHADMLLAADGTVLYMAGESLEEPPSTLVWVSRSGDEQPLDPGVSAQAFRSLALSPDGRRLAVSVRGNYLADEPNSQASQTQENIFIKELPDGPFSRLTNDSGRSRRPVWSPDGTTIAHISSSGNPTHVRSVRSDGSSAGEFQVLLDRERPVLEALFTPDGGRLIFREGDANVGDADLGFVDLETGLIDDSLLASDFNERAIALSPDGRWLAYVSDLAGRDEVFVRPFPLTGEGRTPISINGGIEPVWAHNGRELFYREPESGGMMAAAYVTDPTFQVENRQMLFLAAQYQMVGATSYHSYDVANDDQRFVMARPQASVGSGGVRLVLVENFFQALSPAAPGP